jgi:hypothetical protein
MFCKESQGPQVHVAPTELKEKFIRIDYYKDCVPTGLLGRNCEIKLTLVEDFIERSGATGLDIFERALPNVISDARP